MEPGDQLGDHLARAGPRCVHRFAVLIRFSKVSCPMGLWYVMLNRLERSPWFMAVCPGPGRLAAPVLGQPGRGPASGLVYSGGASPAAWRPVLGERRVFRLGLRLLDGRGTCLLLWQREGEDAGVAPPMPWA